WTVDTTATSSTIVTHVQLLLFVWAICQLSLASKSRRLLAQAFVLGAFVTAANVAYVFIFHSERVNLDGRTTALGGNHNDVAAVLALGLVVAWWLMTYRRNWRWSLVNLAYLPVGLFAIILTGSRGGALAASAALVAIVLSLRQVRPTSRLLFAAAIVGSVALALSLPS